MPDEILSVIFSFLHPTEVVNTASHVCRRWASVCNDADVWRRQAEIRIASTSNRQQQSADNKQLIFSEIKKSRQQHRKLKKKVDLAHKKYVNKLWDYALEDYMRRLKRAVIYDHDVRLRLLLVRHPKLRRKMDRERLGLLAVALTHGSIHCLPLLHAWCDEGQEQHCIMQRPKDAARITPSLHVIISKSDIRTVDSFARLHAGCCRATNYEMRFRKLMVAAQSSGSADMVYIVKKFWHPSSVTPPGG
jgi:hypothetical protein